VRVRIDGEERTLKEGEVLIVAPGIPHTMWAEETGTRVNWQTRPPLQTEAFFETVWGWRRTGRLVTSMPNLLRVALIAWEYEEEYRLVSPTRAVQRALLGSLAHRSAGCSGGLLLDTLEDVRSDPQGSWATLAAGAVWPW
jgi:hypothetical protein